MWPWGHLAFGYLAYALYVYGRRRESPAGWPVVVLAFATQFPDLVDKPLAYTVAVLPEGRSLAHSVLVLVPVCVGAYLLARRYHRAAWGLAFAIGYATHLVGDGYSAALAGQFEQLTFLLWPVLAAPDYEAASFDYHARVLARALARMDAGQLGLGDPFVLEVWLAVLVVVLWVLHGMPPFRSIRRRLAR